MMNMYHVLACIVFSFSLFLGYKDTMLFLKLYHLPMENM